MKLPGRALDLGIAALAAGQLAASAWLRPVGDQVVWPDGTSLGALCWFRTAFGVDCPFCGLTRSFVALAHGELGAAIDWHPAGPLLFVAMAVFLGAVVIALVRRSAPVVERRAAMIGMPAIAAVCVVLGVFRMVRS
jgi:hypothetical protein